MPGHSHVDDRTGEMASYVWEDVDGSRSLWDWWVEQLRETLAPRAGPYLEHDVRRFLDLCEPRRLSRDEVAEFVRRHRGQTPGEKVPVIPGTLEDAWLCRDEANIKIVLWSAQGRYWTLSWSLP